MAQRTSGGGKTRSRSEKPRSGSRAPTSAARTPTKRSTAKTVAKGPTKKAAKNPKNNAAAKTAAKKSPARKASAKPADKKPGAKKSAAKKAGSQKAAQKKSATARPAKKAASKATQQKASQKRALAKKAPAKSTPAKKATKTAVKAAAKSAGKTAVKTATKSAPSSETTKPGTKTAASRPSTPLKQAATAAPRPSGRGRKPLTPDEREEMKGVLKAERSRLEREIASAVEDLNELLRDSGDGSGDDQADAGSKTFEREHEMSVANNSRDLLVQVEHALGRIANGTYGTCESCGLPIGKMRLEAFPRATLCVDCKQREERR